MDSGPPPARPGRCVPRVGSPTPRCRVGFRGRAVSWCTVLRRIEARRVASNLASVRGVFRTPRRALDARTRALPPVRRVVRPAAARRNGVRTSGKPGRNHRPAGPPQGGQVGLGLPAGSRRLGPGPFAFGRPILCPGLWLSERPVSTARTLTPATLRCGRGAVIALGLHSDVACQRDAQLVSTRYDLHPVVAIASVSIRRVSRGEVGARRTRRALGLLAAVASPEVGAGRSCLRAVAARRILRRTLLLTTRNRFSGPCWPKQPLGPRGDSAVNPTRLWDGRATVASRASNPREGDHEPVWRQAPDVLHSISSLLQWRMGDEEFAKLSARYAQIRRKSS